MIRLDHEIESYLDATEPLPERPIVKVDGWKMQITAPWKR
jgi:hypothetical protein